MVRRNSREDDGEAGVPACQSSSAECMKEEFGMGDCSQKWRTTHQKPCRAFFVDTLVASCSISSVLRPFHLADPTFPTPSLPPSFSRASRAGPPGAVTSVSFPGATATPRHGKLLYSVALAFPSLPPSLILSLLPPSLLPSLPSLPSYILQGRVIVTPTSGGKAVTVGKGDLVTFPEGMSCVWYVRREGGKEEN